MNPEDMHVDQLAEAIGVAERLERVRNAMVNLIDYVDQRSTESGDAADELSYRIGNALNLIDAGGWRR